MRPDERSSARRVVVTGLGPISGIGCGVGEFGASLRAGRSGFAPIRSFDASGFPHRYACEVKDFRPELITRRLDPRRWGRSSQFAAAAARLAADDAGLDEGSVAADRFGVVMGTTSGESQVVEALTAQAVDGQGSGSYAKGSLAKLPAARLAHAASEELGAAAVSVTLANACSASNYALGYAYDLLVCGEVDVVAAGGADSVCRWAHAGFYRLGALSKQDCAPFDRDRTGIITAEGGVALVLEAQVDAGVRRGIPARQAAQLLCQTLSGSAELLRRRDYDTLAVRREVSSPGGLTARGTAALERGGIRSAFSDALDAVLGDAAG